MEKLHGREIDDGKSYCYRLEQRKILPGLLIEEDKYGNRAYWTNFYLIVEGSTEKYIDASGNNYKTTSNIFVQDYFKNSDDAKNSAVQMHLSKGCKSKKCEWTKVVEEEKIKKEKKNYNAMFPMSYYQKNKP